MIGILSPCQSQPKVLSEMLDTLASLQAIDDPFYHNLFPSQRIKNTKYNREDNNIFFSALIALTLEGIYPQLTEEDQQKANNIIKKTITNYPNFKSRKGALTYNFWSNQPHAHFPNDNYLSSKEKYALPDDFDDTSLIYATAIFPDSIYQEIHQLMGTHVNGQQNWVKNIYKEYKKQAIYGTWFGHNMPIGLDVCVVSNTLLFLSKRNITLNQHDSISINWLENVIMKEQHFSHPYYVSPHYKNSIIIMYHFARLHAYNPNLFSEKVIQTLQNQAKGLLNQEISFWERVLLTTSLNRLGIKVTLPNLSNWKTLYQSEFSFFVANMLSIFPDPIYKAVGNSHFLHFSYQCSSFNLALLIEAITVCQ